MQVTKLLISPVKKRIFCPKTTKFGPKLAFLVNLGQAMQAYSMPCCGSVGGCGARAVSRKTPIYFMQGRAVAAEFVYGLYSICAHYAHKPAKFIKDTKKPNVFLDDVSDGGITVDFWIIKVHTSN